MSSEYIPMSLWGKDHWSTLMYMVLVAIDNNGFQVGFDSRMRTNRRHHRVMNEQCPAPKRSTRPSSISVTIMRPEHGSRLNDGTVVEGHDDWMCIQDMANEGLFNVVDAGDVQPGKVLHFTERGWIIVTQLMKHKTGGGNFAQFTYSV